MELQHRPLPLQPKRSQLTLPLTGERIAAGFPSPADDYVDVGIDFKEQFIRHPTSTQLDLPSNDTAVLLQVARPLVARIFRPHRQLTKAGVLRQHLQSHDILQTHLMVPMSEEQQKWECLMQTIERINRRYRRGTLQ
ncbi:hypothetical protein [Parasynechococcus sp.]|uniref:DinB/UmuC family translesion DNA polymerase n=1 Tax=Parasynechococcus sp. TaxID=3101203 RepID=UPI0037048BC5